MMTSSPTPTKIEISLDDLLFPTKTPDTLPQDTLTIPKDKWSEKNPVLGMRALKFFQDQGVAPQTLPQDKVELYQLFLGAWGKPWRLHYLTTGFDKEELHLIWDQTLLVQANTPEELSKQKQIVSQTLSKVQPKPELPETTDIKSHFQTQEDINDAIAQGKLVEIKTSNIKRSDKEYAIRPLATIVEKDIDPKLTDQKDILEISSSTRFLKLQTLLKEKLGYLAAKISYHTMGRAIDLKLSEGAKKEFDKYLSEKLTDSTTRLDRATALYKKGIALTVSNLVENSILEKDTEAARAFLTVQDAVRGKGVDIIDETFFGVRLDKDGNITEINPVFHLQYAQ